MSNLKFTLVRNVFCISIYLRYTAAGVKTENPHISHRSRTLTSSQNSLQQTHMHTDSFIVCSFHHDRSDIIRVRELLNVNSYPGADRYLRKSYSSTLILNKKFAVTAENFATFDYLHEILCKFSANTANFLVVEM